MRCRAFPLEHGGKVCDTSDAIGIGQQTVVQIVEVQDGELVYGALPAAGQEQEGRSEEKCPAKNQF